MSKVDRIVRRWDKSYLTLCIVMLALVTGVPATADEGCQGLTIFQVYDQLLPMNTEADRATQQVVVRYLPGDTSSDVERKIVLRELSDGKLSMTVIRPTTTSIQQQLRALRATHPHDCDDALLKSINIEQFEVSEKIARGLYKSFQGLRVPVSMESAIYMDAPRCEVSVDTPMNSSDFVLYGPTLQDRHPHPLLRWCASVVSSAAVRWR